MKPRKVKRKKWPVVRIPPPLAPLPPEEWPVAGPCDRDALLRAVVWLQREGILESGRQAVAFRTMAELFIEALEECEAPSEKERATTSRHDIGRGAFIVTTERPFYAIRRDRFVNLERAYFNMFACLREVAKDRRIPHSTLEMIEATAHLLRALAAMPSKAIGRAVDAADTPRRAATAKHTQKRTFWEPYLLEACERAPTETAKGILNLMRKLANGAGVTLPKMKVTARTVAVWRKTIHPRKKDTSAAIVAGS